MEYHGNTLTSSYMSAPRLTNKCGDTYLPSITMNNSGGGGLNGLSSSRSFVGDSTGFPSPLRRSLTTLSWRPATYYKTVQTSPNTSLLHSQTAPLNVHNSLSELEGIKVPPVFSAARNALYTRYTPNDWLNAQLGNYTACDRVQSNAERLRYDTVRLAKETDDKTKRAQEDVGKRLGERINDINFWKLELNSETDNMINEINRLNEAKRVAEKALAETENPLHIAQECLYNREKRQGVDLVHDCAEKDLLKEVDIIKQCQEKIRRIIDKANTQLNIDRAAQHELERDSGDKFRAQQQDETCHSLKNTSAGINYHNGIETMDNCISVPETWADFSNKNLQRSQAERESSKQIRSQIEDVLNQCMNDMWKHWNSVNTSLTQRIQETTDARNKLQAHLNRVLQEIFDMEKNIEFIKKCISEKEIPLQVAQTRLQIRTHRPNMELCRDPAQHRLVEEVHEIRESIEQLMVKLREAENALQHLLRVKSTVEHDLSIKNNSLFIDREKCLALRKTFPMTPKIAGSLY